ISAASFALGLKSDVKMWRISRSNSIIRSQDYRVSASRLAESNFRYTHVHETARAAIRGAVAGRANSFRAAIRCDAHYVLWDVREQSGTVTVPGARYASGSCPAGCMATGGAGVVAANGAAPTDGGSRWQDSPIR